MSQAACKRIKFTQHHIASDFIKFRFESFSPKWQREKSITCLKLEWRPEGRKEQQWRGYLAAVPTHQSTSLQFNKGRHLPVETHENGAGPWMGIRPLYKPNSTLLLPLHIAPLSVCSTTFYILVSFAFGNLFSASYNDQFNWKFQQTLQPGLVLQI